MAVKFQRHQPGKEVTPYDLIAVQQRVLAALMDLEQLVQSSGVQLAANLEVDATKAVNAADDRLTDFRPPSGAAGGQLGGTYPNPDVRGVRTTTGPTLLTLGAVADGQFLQRVGATVVGGTAGAPTWTSVVKDLGTGLMSGTFDITGLAGLVANKPVNIFQTAGALASKGNARDEFLMDPIVATGYVVDATTIRVYWAADNIVVGDYEFAYTVSS